MEILPRYFVENSFGLLTNSDIESLYFTTMNSLDQSTKHPLQKNLIDSAMSNNEIDCTIQIEVENPKKVASGFFGPFYMSL